MRTLLVWSFVGIAAAQGTWQKPGEIQQPKGPWQVPGQIQVPKGIQAIRTQEDKCQRRLIVGADALFDFDKAELTPAALETLNALGPMIRKSGKHPVTVEGHTDSVGSSAYNQELSERRAQAVRDWLATQGYVDTVALSTKGYGKIRPVAPNTTAEGRQKNRRVEIVIDTCQ